MILAVVSFTLDINISKKLKGLILVLKELPLFFASSFEQNIAIKTDDVMCEINNMYPIF